MNVRDVAGAMLLAGGTAGISLVSGAAFRAFAGVGAAPETIAMLAGFFAAMALMILLPQLWLADCGRRGVRVLLDVAAAFIGVGAAGFFALPMLPALAGAAAVAAAFAFMMFAAGKLAASFFKERGGQGAAALLTAVFIVSPFWSACLLAAGDFGRLAAVWFSPLAMLGAALPQLNFSCLPGLYSLWMGSLCPVPNSVPAAAAAYALPGLLLYAVSHWKWLWK